MNLLPYERTAYYYETDQMGVVHHSNYIRWMEEARIHMIGQLGTGYHAIEEAGIIIPVIGVACNYKSSVHFHDTVMIISKLESFNGIKFHMSYEILDKKSGDLRATGTSSHCFLNKDFVPVRLKKTHPDIYQAFANAVEA